MVRPVQARPTVRYNWPRLIGLWALVGVFLTGHLFLEVYFPMDPWRLVGATGWMIYTQMARAFFWLLLTPLVLELGRRIPLHGWWAVPGTLLHLCFALAIMMWIFLARLWAGYLYFGTPVEFLTFERLLDGFTMRTFYDVAIYAAVIAVGRYLEVSAAAQERRLNESRLEAQLAQARLDALRRQMHPHFLHNSLNAIAELVRDAQNDQAVESIVKLSRLHRTLMQSAGDHLVPFEDELSFIRDYLDLEQLRFGERLAVTLDVDPAATRALVPALVLQPLVENAAKHGIAPRLAPGRITLRATRHNDLLRIEVVNDLPEANASRLPGTGTGVGVANLRARLGQLYGERHRFTLDIVPRREARAVLELPFRLESAGPATDGAASSSPALSAPTSAPEPRHDPAVENSDRR